MTGSESREWLRRAAELYARAGEAEAAIRCAREVGDPALLGRVLEGAGRHAEAAVALAEAGLHLQAGRAWERAGDHRRAAAAWAAGGDHLRAAAALLREPGSAEAALAQAARAREAGGPARARATALLAAALHRLGREAEAEEAFREAERLAEDAPFPGRWEAIGEAAALAGRPDRMALAYARARAEASPRGEEARERVEAAWTAQARRLGNRSLGAALASLRAAGKGR